jgi:hypothetical protein
MLSVIAVTLAKVGRIEVNFHKKLADTPKCYMLKEGGS